MKKLIIFIFIAISASVCISFFSSCQGIEDDIVTVPRDSIDTVIPHKLKLLANKTSAYMFEAVDLELEAQGWQASFLDYDTIVWDIPGIFYSKTTSPNYIIGKQQSFAYNGDYKVKVYGYKADTIASMDSVTVRVPRPGDFLCINWSNSNTPLYFFDYAEQGKNYALNMFHQRRDTVHALVNYKVLNAVDVNDSIQGNLEGRQVLYDYVKSFYGEAEFKYDGSDISNSPLVAQYNSRFLLPLDSIDRKYNPTSTFVYMPVAIWDEDASRISLLGTVDTGDDPNTYFKVIAEPRRIP